MKNKLISLAAFLFLVFSLAPKEAQAQYFNGAVGAAVSTGNGFYNPIMGGGYGGGPGFNPFWGGGYNLNSLNGGGWGGYPAGYGVPFGYGQGGFGGGVPSGGGGCNGGAMTGGFGGFYSPFVGH